MTRSVSSGNKVLIRCSISLCGNIGSLWHLWTVAPWFHTDVCLCVTTKQQCLSSFIIGSQLFFLFHPLLQMRYSLFISAISSICLHVLHALLIVIKEYSPIREMLSILYCDIRSQIHQKSAVKMSCNKWCLTLLLKTWLPRCFKETSTQ